MKSPTTLIEAVIYFSKEDICIQYMAKLRWPSGAICPTCGRTDVSYLEKQKRWQCKSAHSKRQFSAKSGTIFEDSAIGLDKWLPAVWAIVNSKNGISSYELGKAIGVTQKTAWFMAQRIRAAMEYDTTEKLTGTVEADETYVGGKSDLKHKYSNKQAVIGVVEKKKDTGKVRAFATKQADATVAVPFLRESVAPDSVIHTDESRIYNRVKRNFDHQVVNHSELEYVRNGVSTNTIDGFWNLFKRSYKGTYTHLSAQHLNRYVQEHSCRYNTRTMNDGDRFEYVINGVIGKRLSYKSLICKTP